MAKQWGAFISHHQEFISPRRGEKFSSAAKEEGELPPLCNGQMVLTDSQPPENTRLRSKSRQGAGTARGGSSTSLRGAASHPGCGGGELSPQPGAMAQLTEILDPPARSKARKAGEAPVGTAVRLTGGHLGFPVLVPYCTLPSVTTVGSRVTETQDLLSHSAGLESKGGRNNSA